MYQIFADGKLLYAPNLVDDGFGVINPVLTLEVNKAGSLTFTLPTTNRRYNDLNKLKTIITVFDGNDQIFRGRVLHDEKDYMNHRAVYCEGELSFLLDSIVRPYDYQGAPSLLFQKYIADHNEQVGEEKRFALGTVEVADNNNYVHYSSSQYPNTWDEIEQKLLDTHGGYLMAHNQVIDYIYEPTDISDQVIEFGRNLLDITEYISADEVFTALIPLGATIAEEQTSEEINLDEEQPEKRLTIEGVNGGKDYIEDEDAIALFGRITKVNTWDDVTEASNLLTKGIQFLADGVKMSATLTIKAVDLHLLNVDTDRIRVGQMVRVLSLPHGIDKYLQCSRVVLDMVSADKSEYTLGLTMQGVTDQQVRAEKVANGNSASVAVVSRIADETRSATEQAANNIAEITDQLNSNYVRTADFIPIVESLADAMHIKGRTQTLPGSPSIGDVYSLTSSGAAYVYTSSGWVKLSEDISELATESDLLALEARVAALEGNTT